MIQSAIPHLFGILVRSHHLLGSADSVLSPVPSITLRIAGGTHKVSPQEHVFDAAGVLVCTCLFVSFIQIEAIANGISEAKSCNTGGPGLRT